MQSFWTESASSFLFFPSLSFLHVSLLNPSSLSFLSVSSVFLTRNSRSVFSLFLSLGIDQTTNDVRHEIIHRFFYHWEDGRRSRESGQISRQKKRTENMDRRNILRLISVLEGNFFLLLILLSVQRSSSLRTQKPWVKEKRRSRWLESCPQSYQMC